jgi:hypothetical protein
MTEPDEKEFDLPPVPPKCAHCESTEHTTDGHFEGSGEVSPNGHFEGSSAPMDKPATSAPKN